MSNPKRARSPYELTLATWQDPIKDANFAFDGAVFHFRELEELVRGGKAHREDSARLH